MVKNEHFLKFKFTYNQSVIDEDHKNSKIADINNFIVMD